MTAAQFNEVTIFHLDRDEFEDAEIKNSCLIQTETTYIAFVLDLTVRDEEFFAAIQEEGSNISQDGEKGDLTVFVSEETDDNNIDYIGTFELIGTSITALLFSKKLIRWTGAFNTLLSEKSNFEFVCRTARVTGACMLRQAACGTQIQAERQAYQEDIALTFAYMIRYHMRPLHSLGMTDHVFSVFCQYAQAKGIFPAFQQQINLLLSDERVYGKIAGQTAPFIILRGDDTCGGVLQGFADELADSLICNGQAVIVIDDNPEIFDELQNMVCKGIVGFQNKALEIDFFRKIHGSKFQFWFDNPLHFENILRNLPEEYYILCQDANYAELIRKYYHTGNAVQFPPGGNTPDAPSCGSGGEKRLYTLEERPYDIVFMGNFFQDSAENLGGFEREFYDYMLLHPSETFEQGLAELLQEKGKETDEEGFVAISLSLKQACRMVIGHFRNAVVSAVLKAGFTLHVYGDSWANYRGEGKKHLEIHPYAAVKDSRRELAKAKLGLNVMSWHKAGMTERIANIMLSGAVCLTEETTYLREHMREGEDIVTFRLDRLEELPEKVKELLANPGLRESIADNARRTALERYTWERRAKELIALSENAEKKPLNDFAATMTGKKRLVLFRGELDTLNLFSEQLKQGFLELGYEIFDFDLCQSTRSLGLLYEYMQTGLITAMIGFNSMFFGMETPSGKNMWEVLGIPCVNILVDHPYWYHNILMRMPSTGIILCIDRNHMDYVNRFYSNIPSNGFLAHGGTALCREHKPVSDRTGDVLYAGSLYADYIQKPDFSEWAGFPAEQICDQSIQYLLAHPTETIEAAVERQLRQEGIRLPDEELRRFISSCVYIERVVSSHYRERIVGSIARSGISLELYGDGWSGCDWIRLPNVHYGGRVSPEEILDKMEDSKIVLNTFPWFKDGSHERVFNAMLCGAVVVSEASRYLNETLPEDAWIPFELTAESLSALPRRIAGLLSDKENLQEIASTGQKLAEASHTWRARARELHEDLLSYL